MRAVLCTLILLPAAAALAQAGPKPQASPDPAPLSVTHAPGAEPCLDTPQLLARIGQLRAHAAPAWAAGYDVRFTRGPDGFTASIRARAGGAERVLHDSAATCAALGEATAVTLALLLDGGARERTDESPQNGAAATAGPSSAAEVPPAALGDVNRAVADHADAAPATVADARDDGDDRDDGADSARVHAVLAVGGAAMAFVVRPLAPAVLGEAGIAFARVQLGLGALWIPRQEIEHGPGALRESLLSGTARACLLAVDGAALRLQLCSGVHVGVLDAQAESYTRNDAAAKLWLALPFELAVGSAPAPLGWELSAAALAPLVRHDFSIDGVGVAYESPPVGVLVALRASCALGP
jgi:hypothetical protein